MAPECLIRGISKNTEQAFFFLVLSNSFSEAGVERWISVTMQGVSPFAHVSTPPPPAPPTTLELAFT